MKTTVILSLIVITITAIITPSCSTHRSLQGSALPRPAPSLPDVFDQEKLQALEAAMHTLDTTSLVVLHQGKLVYQYGDASVVSYLASCRKSILSMLYGKYVHDGTIDLNQTLGSIGIDDNDGLLDSEKQATIDHVITARSGIFHPPANGGYDKDNVLPRGSVAPGEYFLYNNWDFNVAGHLLEELTGRSVYQEIEDQLAIPLGFEDWSIRNQKRKHGRRHSQYSAYHMYLSTRDMARIGQLMLNGGQWGDEQLIPEAWVRKITSPVTSLEEVNARYGENGPSGVPLSYGYMWWLHHAEPGKDYFEGAYSATGWGGQFITVLPKLDMVVAHKAKLGPLVRWGLISGGVPDYRYWQLIDQLMAARR